VSSLRVKMPLKTRCDISSFVNAAHLVGYDNLLQIIKMVIWRIFLFELAEWGVAAL
jgi:hypothetical protein